VCSLTTRSAMCGVSWDLCPASTRSGTEPCCGVPSGGPLCTAAAAAAAAGARTYVVHDVSKQAPLLGIGVKV
jgi:hypothetical protein